MSRYYSYVNSANRIVTDYSGQEPFSLYIRSFFSKNKKYGSRDRRNVAHLCYCYFRLGKSFSKLETEEKILIGLFLCSEQFHDILASIKPEWNEQVELSIVEKFEYLDSITELENVFQFNEELTEGVSFEELRASYFIQPDLFLRLRPGKEALVKNKLTSEGVAFSELGKSSIAITNLVKIDDKIELNREAVVQDLNSQKIGAFFEHIPFINSVSVWDACAGSGGKAIMAKDALSNMDLTVSDVRSSILINLKKRLNQAGILHYKTIEADLANPISRISNESFDLIIADIPCSGSGTWGRTPEYLSHYDEAKTEMYASLQKSILSNLVPKMKNNGFLLYITCSVFKNENEENVNFLTKNFELEEVKRELCIGYDKKADTMFVSLLRKRN